MKKLLLFIGLIIIFISCDHVVKTDRGYEQTGTGWKQNYTKNNFRDSSYFTKELRIGGTWRVGATTVTTTGAQLNFINTLTGNAQDQFNDTISLSAVAVLKHADTLLVTDNYTLVAADDGRTIAVTKGTFVKITVPLNSSVPFTNSTVINFFMGGAGIVKFVGASGVHLYAAKDSVTINTQWGWATLRKRGTNNWNLFGHLED